MDRAEELAEKYLQSLGYSPKFEPNGEGTFPDFEATPMLAAEARFLNEHYFKAGKPRGLREESQPLIDRLESVFRKFDAQYAGRTYFVFCDFQRPLSKNAHVRKSLHRVLIEFLNHPETLKSYAITERISVQFIKADKPIDGITFHTGGLLDRDSGGWLVSNFIQNIRHCIADKSKKQEESNEQYQEWWLILTDQIAYGFSEQEKAIVLSTI